MMDWRRSYYSFLANKWLAPIWQHWHLIVLLGLLIFSYQIRAMNIIPDRLVSFDPIFQYRFTWYFVNWGHLPAWDELTYYVGRIVGPNVNPPLMYYLTAVFYWLQPFGWSLMTACAYASAIYGAIIIIPAYLLGKEMSNKYGGLLAALLVGVSPQILGRTFGSSYDTDQLVLFFMLFTLYTGFMLIKRKDFKWLAINIVSFSLFFLMWNNWTYTLMIIAMDLVLYFVLRILLNKSMMEGFKESVKDIRIYALLAVGLIISLELIGFVATKDDTVMTSAFGLFGFATNPEQKIVDVSIAELQPFDVFSVSGWMTAMGNFVTGVDLANYFILGLFTFLIACGIFFAFKKRELFALSMLITLLVVGLYTTFRGFRFTEFTACLFLLMVGTGFGYLFDFLSKKNAKFFLLTLSIIIVVGLVVMDLGNSIGKQVGPDLDANWDNAWNWIKTNTPTDALIGTWWDPGHMITGTAERRDIADGAHCSAPCLYGINDRIVDLGKIMATNDENESIDLIKKYQGTSSKVYWIASNDLIGKYQWLQYFGEGCDASKDKACEPYGTIGVSGQRLTQDGRLALLDYGGISLYVGGGNIPIPIYVQGINAVLFQEVLFYQNNTVKSFTIDEKNINLILAGLKSLETPLNIRFVNQTMPYSVWVPEDYSYIALIPTRLRNTVFTRMFFLNGGGLQCFNLVFHNKEVNIFEVNNICLEMKNNA